MSVRNDELEANTAYFRVNHNALMRALIVHKNIPVSVTKLMLSLPVCFISSHLTVDKLFLVNSRAITGPPKMSLLLEATDILSLHGSH